MGLKWQVYVVIHNDITVVGNLQRRWAQVSRENIRDYHRNLLVQQAIICNKGTPGGCDHEILMLELVKPF